MHRTFWILAILALPLCAQTDRATLTGTVTDQSHAVISGAKVVLTAGATGAEHVAITNGAGAYTLSALQVGRYTAHDLRAGIRNAAGGGLHSGGRPDADAERGVGGRHSQHQCRGE